MHAGSTELWNKLEGGDDEFGPASLVRLRSEFFRGDLAGWGSGGTALLPDSSEVAVDKSTFGEGRRRQVDVTVRFRVSQTVCGSFMMFAVGWVRGAKELAPGLQVGASVGTRERIGSAGNVHRCGFLLLMQPAIPCLVWWRSTACGCRALWVAAVFCGTRGRSAV
jgi:hypothetical protein